jgi:hypothetical protein
VVWAITNLRKDSMPNEIENKEKTYLNKNSLEERLNAHPILKSRIESLLEVVENSANDIEKANEAEKRVIKEIRQMGNDALTAWAIRQNNKKEKEMCEKKEKISKHIKKTLLAYDIR